MYLSLFGSLSSYWVIVCAMVIVYCLKIVYTIVCSPLRKIPGPWYTIWTNGPLTWSITSGRRIYFTHDLHAKYGPIVRTGPNDIAVAGLENYQKVYKTGSGFLKNDWYRQMNQSPRPGIFAISDTREHATRRRMYAKQFSKSSLRAEWEATINGKAKAAIQGIWNDINTFQEADMLKWWILYATDVAAHLIFGESFKMLETGKKNEYIKILEMALVGAALTTELPLVRFLEYLPVRSIKLMLNPQKCLHDYSRIAVENARHVRGKANIFTPIISEIEKPNTTLNEVDVQYEAGNLITAGSDTTGVTLTYLMWAVMRHPQLREALEEEVRGLPESFTDADMEALPLLNATIEECLRLYGAAPGSLPRLVPAPGAVFNGHFVPEGTIVSAQTWTLNRDPDLWEDPERFDPYRFLKDRSSSTQSSTGASPSRAIGPFGTGQHICLGIHLAWMSLRYGLTYFLRDCASIRLSVSATAESMVQENYFLVAPKAHKCMVVAS